jgi:hypothetical protein
MKRNQINFGVREAKRLMGHQDGVILANFPKVAEHGSLCETIIGLIVQLKERLETP